MGALRHFMQEQQQVIYVFVGTHFFDELKTEDFNWANYLVNVKRLYVDYLDKEATTKLLTLPYAQSEFRYEKGIVERIFELTAGQPQLLQKIASEMVNFANTNRKAQLEAADLDWVLEHKVLERGEAVFNIFWRDFAAKTAESEQTVFDIITGKTPSHKPSIRRLQQYDYIKKVNGSYQLRFPLLKQWIEKYKI